MGIENILLRARQFRFQRGDPLRSGVAGRRRILGQCVHDFGIFQILIVFAHLINLDSVCAVKSTMGITRA